MNNFDGFIGIDWSGAKTPVLSKSICVALAFLGDDAPHLSGKIWSRQGVFDWLCAMAGRPKRYLVGIDCNFGYAYQIGIRHVGEFYTAPQLWDCVDKACAADENFFAGGFWRHPLYRDDFWVQGTWDGRTPPPKRVTEMACAAAGLGNPESPFKLIGAKQVGKGGLAGMRLAHRLKQTLGDDVAFWPFEDQEAYNRARLIITEIYPRLFLKMAGAGSQKIRDIDGLNQVLGALGARPYSGSHALSDHETDALISAAGLRKLCGTDTTLPSILVNPLVDGKILKQEGWIFGVSAKK